MKIQTREKREALGIFTFNANDLCHLTAVADICADIKHALHKMSTPEMWSNFTGEIITIADLENAISVLESLVVNDKHSWTLKE